MPGAGGDGDIAPELGKVTRRDLSTDPGLEEALDQITQLGMSQLEQITQLAPEHGHHRSYCWVSAAANC